MAPANILIVEDELLVAADIERQITSMGHHVSGVARSAANAYQYAASVQPDLVLMDTCIKGPVDGIQAAKHLREMYQLPVVFLTADADEDTLRRAVLAESFGYVIKPFNPRALAATIEVALHRHRAETRIAEAERWLSLALRSIGDGVIATDRGSRVSFINPTAEQLTGWSAADAVGKPLDVVFNVRCANNRLDTIDLLERVYTEKTIIQPKTEWLLTRRDGSIVRIDNSVTPICELTQKTIGVVVVFHETQDALIHSVANTTERRDRDDIDAAVARLLLEFKDVQSACVYAIAHEADNAYVACKLAHQRGQSALKVNGWDTFATMLLTDLPMWQKCVEQRAVVQYPTIAGGWRTVFPIQSEYGVMGLLELDTTALLTSREIALVEGVMRILKNHIALLDYGECDTLTGLLNRKTFEAGFDKFRKQLRATSGPADHDASWLAIIDIDKFKSINDTYGHLFGDEVLLLVSQLMKRSFRGTDVLFRFGGEEFVIMLDRASMAGAAIAFDRLRETIENYRFPQVGRVTISLGYTQINANDAPSSCIERADAALYYAKHHGRNNVRHYEQLIATGELTVKQDTAAIELF